MREALGIAAEIQATRLRFPRHVARHDRVLPAPVWRPREPKVVAARADSPPQRKAAAVMAKFCEVYTEHERSLTVADLAAQTRTRRVSWARHVCIRLVRDITGMSTPEIGKRFGGRDHTSVLYALLHAADHMATEPALKATHDTVAAFFEPAAANLPLAATEAAVVIPTPTAAAGHSVRTLTPTLAHAPEIRAHTPRA